MRDVDTESLSALKEKPTKIVTKDEPRLCGRLLANRELDYDSFETIFRELSRAHATVRRIWEMGSCPEPDLPRFDLDGAIRKVQDEFPVDLPEPRLFYWRIREPLQETRQ